ncbi:MAG: sigma 54-interacting transcriptional regulator [Candidatus Brocadiaceae bacterium]
MSSRAALSSGIPAVDRLLGGLVAGDNVVWEVDSGAPVDTFLRCYARAGAGVGSVVFLSFNRSPQAIFRKYGNHIPTEKFVLVDCFTSGKGNSDRVFSDFYSGEWDGPETFRTVRVAQAREPDKVVDALEALEGELDGKAFYIFDSLTGMAELWSDEQEALSFFTCMCPRLYDLETVAYWVLEKEAHSEQFLAGLRHVTQVVIELAVEDGRPAFTLRKAEGRRSSKIGIPQALRIQGEEVEFAPGSREELEVAVLSEVSEAVGGALDLGRVLEQTMDVLARELEMKRGTLVLLDKASGKLRIAAAHGLDEQEKARGEYEVGEGVTGEVVRTGKPVAVADISKDARFLNRTGARSDDAEHGKVSFVCVPLRVDGEVIGAMSIDRHFADEQTLARDQRLLQIIASLVSQAIKINRMVMVEREELMAENLRLRKDLSSKYKLGNIVAASGAMQDVVATAGAVARSNATVLIRGETGTGKELIASVLHYNSDRPNGPFVKVNCGALAEGLLESELFGHVEGAFTGAVADRKGRFELAHEGTIFLDEVGAMSEKLQVKLLRVLQEKQFERVGGSETVEVDVRVVAATNQDLEKLLEEGAFREDLYYRLNVIPIFIPPLRERREDIPFLVEHFLDEYGRQYGKDVSKMSREVLEALTRYPWPGNVRELESCIERAVVLSADGAISMDLLPVSVRSFAERGAVREPIGRPGEVIPALVRRMREDGAGVGGKLYDRVISQVEKALIRVALESNDGVQTRTAQELGISRNTLRRKMDEYGLAEA